MSRCIYIASNGLVGEGRGPMLAKIAPQTRAFGADSALKRTRRVACSVIFWLSGGIFVSTLFLGWYVVRFVGGFPGASCTANEVLYPFWVTVSAAGRYCPASEIGSFPAAGLSSTGLLYLVVGAMVIMGAISAFLAGGLLFTGRRDSRSTAVLLLAVISMIAGGAAPVMLALEQPSTICSDQGYQGLPLGSGSSVATAFPANNSTGGAPPPCNHFSFWSGSGTPSGLWGSQGPWNSFVGTASPGAGSFGWGPWVGWFFVMWGVILVAIAIVVSRREGKQRARGERSIRFALGPSEGGAPSRKDSEPPNERPVP